MTGRPPNMSHLVPYEGTRRSHTLYTVLMPNTIVIYDCESYFLISDPPKVEAWQNVNACSHQSSPIIFPHSQNTQSVVVATHHLATMWAPAVRILVFSSLWPIPGASFFLFHLPAPFAISLLSKKHPRCEPKMVPTCGDSLFETIFSLTLMWYDYSQKYKKWSVIWI